LVADYGNHKIRLVETATGVVSDYLTPAGFTGLSGVVANAAGTMLHVSGSTSHNVASFGMPGGPTASPSAPTSPTFSWTIGSGTAGMKDGTRTAAELSQPFDVAIDPLTGELVVSCFSAHYVSRISAVGRANRFVGDGTAANADGTTIAAQIHGPIGAVVAAGGVTYLTSYNGFELLQVTAGGALTNFAGSGTQGYSEAAGSSAQFYNPMYLAMFSPSAVYVSDQYNHVVRTVTVAGATTSLVAGTPTTLGFIDGPATSARFYYPSGIAFTTGGIAFICDVYNYAVRKMALDLSVTTLAGTGATGIVNNAYGVQAGFDQPSGLAVWSDTHLFVADYLNQKIRLVDIATGLVSDFIGSGLGTCPGIASNTAGTNVYVASKSTQQVMVFGVTPSTVTASPVAPTMPTLSWIAGGTSGVAGGTRSVGKMASPQVAAIDPTSADVIVASYAGHVVQRVSSVGRINTFVGDGTAATADGLTLTASTFGPTAVSINSIGVAYVGEHDGRVVRAVTTAGAASLLAGSGANGYAENTGALAVFARPAGVEVFGTATLYVADQPNNRIRSVATGTGTTTLVAGTGGAGFIDGAVATFFTPRGLAAATSGVLYVSDLDNYAIRKVALDGSVATLIGTGVTGMIDAVGVLASMGKAYGLAVNDNGFVFFPDAAAGKLRMCDSATGLVTTLLTGLGGPMAVATDGVSSKMFVVRANYVAAYGVAPATVTAAPTAPTFPATSTAVGICGSAGFADGAAAVAQFAAPTGLALDTLSSDVFVIDAGNNRVRRATLGGAVTTYAGSGTAGVVDATGVAADFSAPSGAVCDAAGILFVVETGGHVVRKITTAAAVTTLAGAALTNAFVDATGAAARFDAPNAVCLGSSGSAVLVADTANNRVRHVVVATGAVTTYAGSGVAGFTDSDGASAQFNAPSGIAMDSTGVAFVTEAGNHALRKIAADRRVSTVAGTGAAGSTNVAGVLASLSAPRQLSERLGYWFIADAGNSAVRLVSPAGLVTTVKSGLSSAQGIAVRGSLVAVADTAAHCIQLSVIPPTDTATVTPAPTRSASLQVTASPSRAASTSRSPTATLPTAAPTTAPPATAAVTTAMPSTVAPTATMVTTAAATTAAATTVAPTTVAPTTVAPTTPPTAMPLGLFTASFTKANYRAHITVTCSVPTTAVHVIAYTDPAAAVRSYTTLSTSPACQNVAANQSVTCTRATLATTASWTFHLYAKAPSYFRGTVPVRLHITGAAAAGQEVSVVLERAASNPAATGAPTPYPDGSGESLNQDASARGVFSLDGGCTVPKLPLLIITLVVFIAALAIRVVVLFVGRRAPIPLESGGGVSEIVGLAPQHVWIGAAMPCHADCGPIHTVLLFVHVLAIMAVASGLLTAFPASSTDNTFSIAFAVAAAFAAAALRPVTALLFDMHRVVDQRLWHVGRDRRPHACDLDPHGVGIDVGVSRATLASIHAVPFQDESGEDDCGAAGKDETELMATSVTVKLGRFRLAGFAACAFVSVALMLAVLASTAPWCGTRVAVYEQTLLAALCLDVIIVQPVYVLFVWLWRWMVSEEEDGRAVHTVHPIDGQRRVVGPLWDDRVEEYVADAVGDSRVVDNVGNVGIDVDEL
jgi:sugar lactone lactonase YvrE